MNGILLFLLSLCQVLQQICAQVNNAMATTAIVNNGQSCLCYPGTTCPTNENIIDIRIVNMGTTCPSGQVYCCTTTGNDTSCGISKISSSPHPPGQADYGAYPWQVAILTTNNNYVGGGVLVRPNYVLTAAHKVQNYTISQIKARLGAWNWQYNTGPYPYVDISISNIILNPQYNSKYLQKDIAVLKLSSAAPIATSPNINTACLPSAAVAVGTRCWVTGWGKNAFGSNGMYQTILKEVDVFVVSQADCQMAFRMKLGNDVSKYLDSSTMCAGGVIGKDACTGDGGSPLVCSINNGPFQVVGLVTWGIGCADAGKPGVYANVYDSISWITEQMT